MPKAETLSLRSAVGPAVVAGAAGVRPVPFVQLLGGFLRVNHPSRRPPGCSECRYSAEALWLCLLSRNGPYMRYTHHLALLIFAPALVIAVSAIGADRALQMDGASHTSRLREFRSLNLQRRPAAWPLPANRSRDW